MSEPIPQPQTPALGTRVQPPTEEHRPIDLWDWFKLSREWLTSADKRIADESESIINAIKWFFGLGTAGTAAGLLIAQKPLMQPDPWLLSACVLAFLLSYTLATLSRLTRAGLKFQEASYTEIRTVYITGNTRANVMLLCAGVCLLLGMGLFPVIFLLPQKLDPPSEDNTTQPYLRAGLTLYKGPADTLYLKDLAIEYRWPGPPGDSVQLGLFKGISFARSICLQPYADIADSTRTIMRTISLDMGIPLYENEHVFVTIGPLHPAEQAKLIRAEARRLQ